MLAQNLVGNLGLVLSLTWVGEFLYAQDRIVRPDFSIQPPAQWAERPNSGGHALVLQAGETEPGVAEYARTIQVLRMSGPVYMDEAGLEEYGATMQKKLSTLPGVDHVAIREASLAHTQSGREALRFYMDFTTNQVSMMQATLVVSNEKEHLVLLYTDLASRFTGANADFFLQEAWDTLLSVEMPGQTPRHLDQKVLLLGILGLTLAGGVLGWRYRRHKREAALWADPQ